ncbi:hypothetical protein SAMN04489709_114115 [Paracidovorax citrulli]|nr:hypothetical protein SAMN04489709_114115 [Paracidovorax citrulli]
MPTRSKLATAVSLASVRAGELGAVFYPGGHSPLRELIEDAQSIALITR